MRGSRKRPLIALAVLVLVSLNPARGDTQPAAAPIEEPGPRRYGDRGTSEIAVGLGYSSVSGFLGAGGFRYFVIDRLAPGFEGTYVHGGTGVPSYGLALASLRFVPVQSASVALLVTGRTGRVFLADHVMLGVRFSF